MPLAEQGKSDDQVTNLVAKNYLEEINSSGVDTLILGCTHYPLLLEAIRANLTHKVALVDSANPTARMLMRVLQEDDLLGGSSQPNMEILVTDRPERVYRIASKFFGEDLQSQIRQVEL